VPSIPNAVNVAGLCEIANPGRYSDEEWHALHADLERYAVDKHCFQAFNGAIVRKGWEWTHCLYGLRRLGMLKPEHRARGVGAGHEPVIYYLGGAQVQPSVFVGAHRGRRRGRCHDRAPVSPR